MSKINEVTNNKYFINANMDSLIQEGLDSIGIQVEDTSAIRDVYCGKDGIMDAQVERAIHNIHGMWSDIVTTTHTKIDIPYMTELHHRLDDAVPAHGMLRAEPIEINGKIVKDQTMRRCSMISNLSGIWSRLKQELLHTSYILFIQDRLRKVVC